MFVLGKTWISPTANSSYDSPPTLQLEMVPSAAYDSASVFFSSSQVILSSGDSSSKGSRAHSAVTDTFSDSFILAILILAARATTHPHLVYQDIHHQEHPLRWVIMGWVVGAFVDVLKMWVKVFHFCWRWVNFVIFTHFIFQICRFTHFLFPFHPLADFTYL